LALDTSQSESLFVSGSGSASLGSLSLRPRSLRRSRTQLASRRPSIPEGSLAGHDLQVVAASYSGPSLQGAGQAEPHWKRSRTMPAESDTGPDLQADGLSGEGMQRALTGGPRSIAVGFPAAEESAGPAARARQAGTGPRALFAGVRSALAARNWKPMNTAEPGAETPLDRLLAARS